MEFDSIELFSFVIFGGLRKLSGLLMDQGPPRRCGCLGSE